MSLQWTLVAGVVYGEMALIALLMLPWIRPGTWSKIFKSRLIRQLENYQQIFTYTVFGILFLLFFDAIREVRKYSDVDMSASSQSQMAPQADAHIHLRLFRAQRNLYISGFALFFWLVVRRMTQMIALEAQLMASADASMRQATSASAAAEKYLSEQSGKKSERSDDTEQDKLALEVADLRKQLKTAESDRDAMREQAQGMKREYDRLMKDFEQLQQLAEGADEDDGKKDE